MRRDAERRGHVPSIDQRAPGGWVPVFCPACESTQLALEARRAEYRIDDRRDGREGREQLDI